MSRIKWKDGIPYQEFTVFDPDMAGATILIPCDDEGRFVPSGTYGDMAPVWWMGKWWVHWSSFSQAREAAGYPE